MTDQTRMPDLTRPPAETPLDTRLYDLVEERFRRLVRDHPALATFVGIHTEDERLGDGSRDAVEQEIADERAHLAKVEAIDPAGLSDTGRIERELELHNLRRSLFDMDVHRVWERRSTAMDGVGDPLFAIFARDFAPLEDRLRSMTARMEGVPQHLAEHRTRAKGPQVRLWQQLELESATDMPSLFNEIIAAAEGVLPEADFTRMTRASDRAKQAIEEYEGFLRETLATAVDDWPLGRDTYDDLIRLRAFDGLDADQILEIGEEQLAENKAKRVDAAWEIDPTVDEAVVVDRIKRDHPDTFQEALEAYREVMVRARAHLVERGIVTIPDDERIEVIATPGVPAQRHPVRGLLRAAEVRPEPLGDLRRDAVGRAPTRTRCASTTSVRSATRASTRRTRATTSSSRSLRATRA